MTEKRPISLKSIFTISLSYVIVTKAIVTRHNNWFCQIEKNSESIEKNLIGLYSQFMAIFEHLIVVDGYFMRFKKL